MMIREPVVAGRFYPEKADTCRVELARLVDSAPPRVGIDKLFGGIVPHAGWTYSGEVTGKVFRALSPREPAVIVLLGGVHRHRGRQAALFGRGRWETPLGAIPIDSRLAERILGHTNLIVDDPYAHEEEHSLEVQAPFVKHAFPEVPIVPIMVPSTKSAHEVGEAVGRTLNAYDYDALVIGTTDLTHYGPHYGFTPMGVGGRGNLWAKEVNDRRFIDLVCRMRGTELVAEASENQNACSSGAAAATIAAVAALGATEGILLDQTCSSEVSSRLGTDSADSVGYAGIVFK